MKIIIILSSIIILIGCTNTSKNTYVRDYNLEFLLDKNDKLSKWKISPLETTCSLKVDSSNLINGKFPLVFCQELLKNIRLPLLACFQQIIVFPDNSADSLSIIINCKKQNLKIADLVITAINKNEDIISVDTLSLIGENRWILHEKKIMAKGVSFVNMKIKISGHAKSKPVKFWIDKIKIKLDGENINNFILPDIRNVDVDKQDIVSLSDSSRYNDIKILQKKKIIALGESVHGSGTINKSAIQLIKHQVENNNCKLIMMELPLEYLLSFNRYVQGDNRFEIDSLMSSFRFMYDKRYIMDLLKWLKIFNEKSEDKVWLMGIDLSSDNINSCMYLFDYIFEFRQKYNLPEVDSICKYLFKRHKGLPKVQKILATTNHLESIIGKKEYKIFSYIIENSYNAGFSSARRYAKRDSLMFNNARFLTNLLCKGNSTAIVYSHLGHAKYKPNINGDVFNIPFGARMRKEYGTNYSCVGVFIGKGQITTTGVDNIGVIQCIESPIKNSLEYSLDKSCFEYLYIPISKISSSPTYIRYIGNRYQDNNYYITTLSSNLDGILYMKNSFPTDMNQSRINEKSSIYKFIRNINKYRNYNKLNTENYSK